MNPGMTLYSGYPPCWLSYILAICGLQGANKQKYIIICLKTGMHYLYTLLEFTLSHIREDTEFSVMLVQFLKLGFYMQSNSRTNAITPC